MPKADVRFAIEPYEFGVARRLAGQLGVSDTLAQILVRRELGDPAAAEAFLAADVGHSLDEFGGLREGAQVVLEHLAKGAHISVHGDYDVDGVCGTAILIRTLRRVQKTLGSSGRLDWLLPDRVADGYGLSTASVDRFKQWGTELIITVDCGITSVDEVAAAKAAGIAVVVTDHHSPRADGVLPDTLIVHPRIGGYPCPELCGTGVAFKLAEALVTAAGGNPLQVEDELDLVAMATVADVVPMIGENRRLVRQGLKTIATTARPGLRALMEVTRVDPGDVNTGSIGFRLAPRINAAGRLYRADAGLELLLTEDPTRGREIALELERVNSERRDVESRVRFDAEAQLAKMDPDASAYVLAGEGWHPGVLGLVASRIAEARYRPTIVIGLTGETGTGSGRSIPGFDLLGGLEANAELLLRHGGHRAAAGLTIAAENIEEFRQSFNAHAQATLRPEDLIPSERIDAVVAGDALTLDLAEELECLEPYGPGNPSVSLLIPAATVVETRPLGADGKHCQFTVEAGGARSRGVAWGVGDSLPAGIGESLDIAARLEVNRFRRATEPRLVLRRAKPPTPAGIQIVGEPNTFSEGISAELERVLPIAPLRPPEGDVRQQNDHRDRGIAGLLSDLVTSGSSVLAVTAHTQYRVRALEERLGGFSLCSWAALVYDPTLANRFNHVVAIDPPPNTAFLAAAATTDSSSWLHLCWGEVELDLSKRILTWEYSLREQLTTLYRELKSQGETRGTATEALLRGQGSVQRAPQHAGRLVRIFHELGLVQLELGQMTLSLAPEAAKTSLDASPSFRAYEEFLQESLQCLGQRTARAA